MGKGLVWCLLVECGFVGLGLVICNVLVMVSKGCTAVRAFLVISSIFLVQYCPYAINACLSE